MVVVFFLRAECLFGVRCSLPVDCYWLCLVLCCLSFAVCCLLFVVYGCSLFAVCCLLFDARCALLVARCLLFVVRRCLLAAVVVRCSLFFVVC